MSGKNVLVCLCVLLAVGFFCAIGITCLVIAVQDGDNPCQGHDRTNLSLKDWLLGYGIADISVVGIVFIGMVLSVGDKSIGPIIAIISLVLWTLFKIAWMIVGIVILARSHGHCVSEGADIGIITVIAIVVQWLTLCTTNGSAKVYVSKKN